MFMKEEASKERISSYSAALKSEVEGYEARIARAEAGHQEPLSVEQLKLRVAGCKAELARVGKLKSKGKESVEA